MKKFFVITNAIIAMCVFVLIPVAKTQDAPPYKITTAPKTVSLGGKVTLEGVFPPLISVNITLVPNTYGNPFLPSYKYGFTYEASFDAASNAGKMIQFNFPSQLSEIDDTGSADGKVSPLQAGIYEIVLMNSAGQSVSNAILITVTDPKIAVIHPNTAGIVFYTGGKYNFKCSPVSDAPVSISIKSSTGAASYVLATNADASTGVIPVIIPDNVASGSYYADFGYLTTDATGEVFSVKSSSSSGSVTIIDLTPPAAPKAKNGNKTKNSAVLVQSSADFPITTVTTQQVGKTLTVSGK